MEKKLLLVRYETSNQGTFGKLIHPSGEVLETLELPWKENKVSKSCIPVGEYDLAPCYSNRFGNVYAVEPVKYRTYIRLHKGNWAGDIEDGFKSDSTGCILIGLKRGKLDNQMAILNSTKALMKLKGLTGPIVHKLKIINF